MEVSGRNTVEVFSGMFADEPFFHQRTMIPIRGSSGGSSSSMESSESELSDGSATALARIRDVAR